MVDWLVLYRQAGREQGGGGCKQIDSNAVMGSFFFFCDRGNNSFKGWWSIVVVVKL